MLLVLVLWLYLKGIAALFRDFLKNTRILIYQVLGYVDHIILLAACCIFTVYAKILQCTCNLLMMLDLYMSYNMYEPTNLIIISCMQFGHIC